jgi:hypothetical protein
MFEFVDHLKEFGLTLGHAAVRREDSLDAPTDKYVLYRGGDGRELHLITRTEETHIVVSKDGN